MTHWREFDYVVVNDEFAQALAELQDVVGRTRGGHAQGPARAGGAGGRADGRQQADQRTADSGV